MTTYELLERRVVEALHDAVKHGKRFASVDLEGIPNDVVEAAAGQFKAGRQNLVTEKSVRLEAERLVSAARSAEESAERHRDDGLHGLARHQELHAKELRSRAARLLEAAGLTKDGERRAPGGAADRPSQPETQDVDGGAASPSLPAPAADDGGGS